MKALCVFVCVSLCRSCASVVHLMGTVPAVKSACCVWGTFGKSAATASVSATAQDTFSSWNLHKGVKMLLWLQLSLVFSPTIQTIRQLLEPFAQHAPFLVVNPVILGFI